jgi:hypothetical protein
MRSLSGYLYLRFPDGLQTGDQWRINCPSCKHDKNKAFINMLDGRAYCFHCDWKAGGWIGLISSVEGLRTKDEVSQWIKDHREDIADPYKSSSSYRYAKSPMTMRLPSEAEPVDPDDVFCAYLESRGLSWIHAVKYDIRKCTTGKYKDRLLFPVYENKELVYFFDRSIDPDVPKEKKTIGIGSRDLYWPIKKSTVVFGLDLARSVVGNGHRRLVIAEGIFSALSIDGGIPLCTFGKHVSDAQIRKILSVGADEIDVCLDPDAWDCALRLADSLHNYGADVYVRRFISGDPNDYLLNRWPMPARVKYDMQFMITNKIGRKK